MSPTQTVLQPAVSSAVVSTTEWVRARRALLEHEKLLTRLRDEVSQKRRALPRVKLETNYVFDTPHGRVRLSDLFAGRTQLVIYHFMFGPDWAEGCSSCSMVADSIDGTRVHVNQRDTTLVMVSRAPIEKIEAFQKRMGGKIPWVSSYANNFNRDFHVSFTKDELEKHEAYYNFAISTFPSTEAHGVSVFHKDTDGSIFHTYSSYGRGVEPLLGTYELLDMTPKGRDEDGLPYPMAWFRHHDRYPEAHSVDDASVCCHGTEQR